MRSSSPTRTSPRCTRQDDLANADQPALAGRRFDNLLPRRDGRIDPAAPPQILPNPAEPEPNRAGSAGLSLTSRVLVHRG
jgi:hypothetical protein